MSEGPDKKPGVWASLKRIGDTLLATVQNRVELFAVELQEEKCRLVEAILCAAALASFGMMTLSLVTFTVVILFWENGRLPRSEDSARCISSAPYWRGAPCRRA